MGIQQFLQQDPIRWGHRAIHVYITPQRQNYHLAGISNSVYIILRLVEARSLVLAGMGHFIIGILIGVMQFIDTWFYVVASQVDLCVGPFAFEGYCVSTSRLFDNFRTQFVYNIQRQFPGHRIQRGILSISRSRSVFFCSPDCGISHCVIDLEERKPEGHILERYDCLRILIQILIVGSSRLISPGCIVIEPIVVIHKSTIIDRISGGLHTSTESTLTLKRIFCFRLCLRLSGPGVTIDHTKRRVAWIQQHVGNRHTLDIDRIDLNGPIRCCDGQSDYIVFHFFTGGLQMDGILCLLKRPLASGGIRMGIGGVLI